MEPGFYFVQQSCPSTHHSPFSPFSGATQQRAFALLTLVLSKLHLLLYLEYFFILQNKKRVEMTERHS